MIDVMNVCIGERLPSVLWGDFDMHAVAGQRYVRMRVHEGKGKGQDKSEGMGMSKGLCFGVGTSYKYVSRKRTRLLCNIAYPILSWPLQ